ncbi:MAG: YfhO family protein [Dehalococcoidaceae bacterium]|nr:YfhO family protein [Dehalococcoidaceae bacterium]
MPKALTAFCCRHREDIGYIILIFISACIFFWNVILHPGQLISTQSVSGNDITDFFYPMYSYAYSALSEGSFPYWNSMILSGYPLAANPQFGLFYPPSILFLFLPPATAFGLSFLLHVFLGGSFMYLLAKHLGLERICAFFTALVFIFGAFITSHIYAGHYSMICAAVWLPLLFLLFDTALQKNSTAWGLAAGTALGMQILAGHIQITYICLIGLGAYLAYQVFFFLGEKQFHRIAKPAGILAIAVITGILISAVQFFPAYEYSLYTTRAGGLDYSTATSFSLNPGLLSLMVSNPWSGPVSFWSDFFAYPFWEYCTYFGIMPLVLCAVAVFSRNKTRQVKFFILLSAAALLIATGKYFPPYWLLYKLAPGFDNFRVPARFVLLFSFSAAMLSGFGMAYVRSRLFGENVKTAERVIIITFLFGLVAAGAAMLPVHTFSAVRIGLAVLGGLLLTSAAVLYARFKNRFKGKLFDITVIAFTLANLWFLHMPYIDSNPVSEIYQDEPFIVFLQEHARGYRVYDPEGIVTKNRLMSMGIAEINGYEATVLNHYSGFLGDNAGRTGTNYLSVSAARGIQELGIKLNLLNVKYVISSSELLTGGFEPAYSDSSVNIYRNIDALPRAFMVSNIQLADSDENVPVLSEPAEVEIIEYGPHKISMRASCEEPGFLLLSEAWYPAWQASVDGEPGEVLQAFDALMAVSLQPGTHTVEFTYRSRAFEVGVVTSVAGICLVSIVFIYRWWTVRRKRSGAGTQLPASTALG